MGRRGDGAWVERASQLAARVAELGDAERDVALKRVAEEADLSVAIVRRYIDAYDHVRQFPSERVRISLNALEHFKTWRMLDPVSAAAARDAALAGRVPLSQIQRAITDARVRASIPERLPLLPVDAIIDKFRSSGLVDLPGRDLINVPARGESWIGLSADATLMTATDEGAPYLWHRWALLLSPDLPGSPLAGHNFEAFLLRVAAAAAVYEHVSAFCSSAFERDEVATAARGWWGTWAGRLSIL